MIRAALDARSGFPSLVIVDGQKVTFAGSIELGPLVDRDGRKMRDIRPELISEVAEKISDVCCMVERIAIMSQGSRSPDFVTCVKALLEKDGVEISDLIVTARKLTAESISKHLTDWPTSDDADARDSRGWRIGDFAGTRSAAHVLLTDMGISEAPVKGKKPRSLKQQDKGEPVGIAFSKEPEHDTGGDDGTAQCGQQSVTTDSEGQLASVASGRPALSGADPAADLGSGSFEGVRGPVMGIDTGANIGVVIAAPVGAFFRQVFAQTIAVDINLPEERAEFVEGLADIIRRYGVQRVIVERVTGVHGGHVDGADAERAIGAMRAMGTRLVGANWLGGMVEALCMCAPTPIDVETAPASHWRRRLCGGKTTPDDDVVRDVVVGAFPVWPIQSTTHERDAAGLILWDAKERLAQTQATVKTPRQRAAGPAKPRRKEGCTCPLGKKGAHLKGCPARVARSKGTVQMCKVCGQPRKGHVCAGPSTAGPSEKLTDEAKKSTAGA